MTAVSAVSAVSSRLDEAAPAGSDLHYSLLGVGQPQRGGVLAIEALRQQLAALPHSVQDPAVARRKLDWWRRELDTVLSGNPAQHPIIRALATAMPNQLRIGGDAFEGMLHASALDIDYNAYPDFPALQAYCHHAAGSAMLTSQVLGYRQQATNRFAHEFGVGQVLLRLLCRVHADARHGRFYMPDDDLAACELDHSALLHPQDTESTRQLFALQAGRIRDSWQRARQSLPAADRASQRCQLVLAELGLARLDEIERDGFKLLQREVKLTPLRKLWLAWRCRRSERRQYPDRSSSDDRQCA